MIYLFESCDEVTDGALEKLISMLPEDRAAKALRYRQRSDRIACAAAYRLLCVALSREYGLTEFSVCTDENGKPRLAGNSNIRFNLSHSGKYCACVTSQCEVGIDIQTPVKFDRRLAESVCTANELARIDSSADSAQEFIRIWSLKEAYLKMKGIGIITDLKKTDTDSLGGLAVSLDIGDCALALSAEDMTRDKALTAMIKVTLPELLGP